MSNQRNSPNQPRDLPRQPTVYGKATQQVPRQLQQTIQGQQAPAQLREMIAARQQEQPPQAQQVQQVQRQVFPPQAQQHGYQQQAQHAHQQHAHQQQAQHAHQQQAQHAQAQHAQAQHAQAQHAQAQHAHQQQAQHAHQQHAQHAHLQMQGAAPYHPGQAPEVQPTTQSTTTSSKSSGHPGRVRFIRLTYLHLMMAIFAFTGLSWLLMHNPTLSKLVAAPVIKFALGGRWNWSIFLGLFIGAGYLADSWAQRRGNKLVQYMGLALYVVAEAVIFMPLLYIAELKGAAIMAQGGGDPHFIRDAAYISIALFSALTLSVFITKKDFSYLRSGLLMFSASALVLVYLSLAVGFNLGIVFSFAMVFLAGGYVLYYTSQILAHYDHGSHVAASLALFSALALMFWYVIRILMRMRD